MHRGDPIWYIDTAELRESVFHSKKVTPNTKITILESI